MKKSLFLLLLFYSLIGAQAQEGQYPKSFSVTVSNTLNKDRENVLVVISSEQLDKSIKSFNPKAFVVWDGKSEVPSQYNINDEINKGIVFVLDKLKASESRSIVIKYNPKGEIKKNYTKRTQAELSHKTGGEWKNREYMGGDFKNVTSLQVPPEHKDHSWFIRYEGPGWESDKVGYRFYLDQRNAIDVFGKVTPEVSLQKAGLDGFDSYHNMQPWGMDVMKVGKSLGIGSVGSLVNGKAIRVELTDSLSCRITENGDVYSSILTNYSGWKIENNKHDLRSNLTIHAGTRLTHQYLEITGTPANLCTGIVKDKAATLITNPGDKTHFAYMATYGKQSLNNADELGLAVFFDPKVSGGFNEDEFSHIVTLKPAKGKLDYYFLGAWILEPNGIQNEEQFKAYLNQVSEELANPVKVEIVKEKKK
ncbi:MAG TPA: DUF4861 domain-containing protein [Cyclobacteriaceae bacterium]